MTSLSVRIFTFLFFYATVLFGQTGNRPVPAPIVPYDFVVHDSAASGFYLLAPFPLGVGAVQQPAMILDSKGYLYWYALLDAKNIIDFKYNSGAGLYQLVRYKNPQEVWYLLLDTALNRVDSFTTTNGVLPDIHDFQITPDHTYLLAGAIDSLMDLSAYQFGGIPGSADTHAIGFVVQEFDAGHQLLRQWNSNDHIHPSLANSNYGYNAFSFDYCHGNSIDRDSAGNLLISFRTLDAVYKIDGQTGEILWQLGGKTSSFVFPNDEGFSGQHDARFLPNGNISIFDNATMAPAPQVSRAVEYRLDTVDWTATKVWEYRYAPGFHSSQMGGHQTTPTRQHLIGYGLNYRPDPSAVLVDDDGKLLSEIFLRNSYMSYRAYFSELPLENIPRPVIQCTQNPDGPILSAAPGYAAYAWSTGESVAAIQVKQAGTYQVWVNYGAGMLGSEPFTVSDVQNGCPVSKTSEAPARGETKVVRYFDLLGREVSAFHSESPRLYLAQCGDGRVWWVYR